MDVSKNINVRIIYSSKGERACRKLFSIILIRYEGGKADQVIDPKQIILQAFG
jgi:hypothetical protein